MQGGIAYPPSGVRIADADRVRLGAHLASGTTVMHEGFANFNAGTLGDFMVEGRIGQVVSARTLSGQSGLLFRRNSQTGAVEVLPTNAERWGGLNTGLHAKD